MYQENIRVREPSCGIGSLPGERRGILTQRGKDGLGSVSKLSRLPEEKKEPSGDLVERRD